jgi:hypothetical protein
MKLSQRPDRSQGVGPQGLGYTYTEMAQSTAASRRTVERQVLRARAKLNAREGGDPPPPPSKLWKRIDPQLITYQGRTVAAAGPERFSLAPEIARRPAGDPDRTFVIYMCAYAGDVLRGELPGPYSDHDAVRYARAALIPDRLLHRPGLDVERVAQAFGIPPQSSPPHATNAGTRARHEHGGIEHTVVRRGGAGVGRAAEHSQARGTAERRTPLTRSTPECSAPRADRQGCDNLVEQERKRYPVARSLRSRPSRAPLRGSLRSALSGHP